MFRQKFPLNFFFPYKNLFTIYKTFKTEPFQEIT